MAKQPFLVLSSLFFLLISVQVASGSQLLQMPTADLNQEGLATLGYAFQGGQSHLSLEMGVLPRFNVGLGRKFQGPQQFWGTLKIGILEESALEPALALGAEIGEVERHFFAVLSRQLATPQLRAHLALGSGRYSQGMAGLSYASNPVRVKKEKGFRLPACTWVLEYDGKGLNGGLIAQFAPQLKGHLALEGFSNIGFGLRYGILF